MSQLSTFYPAPITATDLGLGAGSNATFGSVTTGAGTFTTLAANNGTITASAPVLDLAQTWNNAAVTFTGLRFNVTETAAAQGCRYFSIDSSGTSIFSIQTSGASNGSEVVRLSGPSRGFLFGPHGTSTSTSFFSLRWQQNLAGLASNAIFAWGSDVYNLNYDLAIQRDAADTLAQRRGANGQTFRLYNTHTDASNHERLSLRWASNVAIIGTEKAGTGSARALEFQTDGVTRLIVSTGGLIQIGGASSAHVALKRNSNTLQIRSADDLAWGGLLCGALTLNGNLDASTRNIVTDTTTGTKIGTGTTQKIGFFNATPVVQQAAIADATDAATTQARLNDLLAAVRTLGLIAT